MRQSNTLSFTYVLPAISEMNAFAYIFENVQLSSRDSAAQAYIFENVTSDIPSPHIWYVYPDEGVRGQVIVVVGHGFGATQDLYNGKITFGPTTPDILTWVQSPPSLNPLPGIIDPPDDLADPEHQRVTFAIPNNAVSGDVRVITNTDLVYSPPPAPPVAKFDFDTAAATDAESRTAQITSSDVATAGEGAFLSAAELGSDSGAGVESETSTVDVTDADTAAAAEDDGTVS